MSAISKAVALSTIVAGEGRTILAVGPFCWGKGKNANLAVRNAKYNLPSYVKRPCKIFVYDAPSTVWVNDMGGLAWDGPDGQIQPKIIREVILK